MSGAYSPVSRISNEASREANRVSRHQLRLVKFGIAALTCLGIAWACAATALAAPFLYVSNQGSDTITPFSASENGALTAGTPVAAGEAPLGSAATPDGRFLYVALNGPPDRVAAFAIAPDGALTPVAGSPFPVGLNPTNVAVGGEGKFLYVANFGSDTISVFAIDSNGALSAVGSPVPTQDGPSSLAFSPNGQFLYVPNFGSASVSAFAVAADGTLSAIGAPTPIAGAFPANAPGAAKVAPDGAHLYVARRQGNLINAYVILPNGSLSAVAGSPFAALSPNSLAFSSEGATLYSASQGSNVVQTFTVDGSGAILAGASAPAGGAPAGLTVGFDGKVLYAGNSGTNNVSSFTIGSGGALAAGPGSPFLTGGTAPSARENAFVDTDDGADFELTGKAKQKQKGKKVKVKVTVTANEPLTVVSGGALKGKGLKNVKLKPVTSELATAAEATVTLKPKKKKAGKKVAKLLGKKKKVTANVKVTGTDDLGNSQDRTLKVTLKGKKAKKK